MNDCFPKPCRVDILRPSCIAAFASFATLLLPLVARAEKPKQLDVASPPQFVRIRKTKGADKIVAMDTAIARYQLTYQKRSRQVDLVGVVHIADKSYYDELNQRLAKYDAVLYELVAPKGTRIPKGGRRSNHPISFLQQSMRRLLDLEFQLEQIDYTPKHFVHADLSPEEFAQSMKDRNESLWKFVMRAMKASLDENRDGEASTRPPSDLELLRAFFARNRALELKRLMAGQLADMSTLAAVFEGPKGSTIITERNKRALEVLRQQLEAGKTRIAIFYGAGHLPDLHTRLLEELHAKPVSTQWLTAWNMED